MTTPLTIAGDPHTRNVYINGRRLSPWRSLQVWNHSPTGFSWGYAGSGPAQLALAILLGAGLSEDRAVRLHQQFKTDYVQNWRTGEPFTVTVDVSAWAAATEDARHVAAGGAHGEER